MTNTRVSEQKEICDITASFDGTWQRRGYENENRKCLAYEFLNKNCKSCETQKSRKQKEEYDSFFKPVNTLQTMRLEAAAMEVTGVLRIYEKSFKELNIWYMIYQRQPFKSIPYSFKGTTLWTRKIPIKGELQVTKKKGRCTFTKFSTGT